jgi:ribosomal protein L36
MKQSASKKPNLFIIVRRRGEFTVACEKKYEIYLSW